MSAVDQFHSLYSNAWTGLSAVVIGVLVVVGGILPFIQYKRQKDEEERLRADMKRMVDAAKNDAAAELVSLRAEIATTRSYATTVQLEMKSLRDDGEALSNQNAKIQAEIQAAVAAGEVHLKEHIRSEVNVIMEIINAETGNLRVLIKEARLEASVASALGFHLQGQRQQAGGDAIAAAESFATACAMLLPVGDRAREHFKTSFGQMLISIKEIEQVQAVPRTVRILARQLREADAYSEFADKLDAAIGQARTRA